MKLIIGLGNPEPRYKGTRHNVGFAVLDEYAKGRGVSFKTQSKFKADIAELTVNGEKVLLAKPTTYYNLVGESARAIMDFYKIGSSDVLIVHDDLALPSGTIRTRIGGSGGGSNGIKSINAHGGELTARLRIGIANDLRERMDDADFVLSKLSASETRDLGHSLDSATTIINSFCDGLFQSTTSNLSTTS